MNKKILLVVSLAALLFTGCSNYKKRAYTEIPLAEGEETATLTEFCAFEDFPQDVPFKVLGVVQKKKGVYGATTSLRPAIMDLVRAKGGNAIGNFHENQRLGLWPWNAVRPVASGDAMIILNPRGKSCAEMGGFAL